MKNWNVDSYICELKDDGSFSFYKTKGLNKEAVFSYPSLGIEPDKITYEILFGAGWTNENRYPSESFADCAKQGLLEFIPELYEVDEDAVKRMEEALLILFNGNQSQLHFSLFMADIKAAEKRLQKILDDPHAPIEYKQEAQERLNNIADGYRQVLEM